MYSANAAEPAYPDPMDKHIFPLPPGTIAPDFVVAYPSSADTWLHNLQGNPVILVFYPRNWEPVSREQRVL